MARIALFGATGRTGKHVLEQALAQDHTVTALVRTPARVEADHPRLRIVAGDVHDAEKVDEVVAGQDAVIMVLGHTRTSRRDVLTEATRHVLAAMQRHGVRRLVALTGAGVADPNDRPRLFNRVMSALLSLLARDLLADSQRQVQAIRESGLEWVVVRAPVLMDGPRRGSVRVGYVGRGMGARVARADVAEFILRQLADDTWLRQAPVISY